MAGQAGRAHRHNDGDVQHPCTEPQARGGSVGRSRLGAGVPKRRPVSTPSYIGTILRLGLRAQSDKVGRLILAHRVMTRSLEPMLFGWKTGLIRPAFFRALHRQIDTDGDNNQLALARALWRAAPTLKRTLKCTRASGVGPHTMQERPGLKMERWACACHQCKQTRP